MMTLEQFPENTICRIMAIHIRDDADLGYLRKGLRAGLWAQVVWRDHVNKPQVVQIQLENRQTVSLPVAFARRGEVRPLSLGDQL